MVPRNPEFCESCEDETPDVRTAWADWPSTHDVPTPNPVDDKESRVTQDIQDGYPVDDDLAARRQQVASHIGETAVSPELAETSELGREASSVDDRSAESRRDAAMGEYAVRATQRDQARSEANVAARTTDNRVNLADDVPAVDLKPTYGGYLDVVMHGDASGTEAHVNGDITPYTLEDTAQLVEQTPGWDHRPVRLLSCSTGQETYAQELANRLDVPVYAPSDVLDVNPDGTTEIENDGRWRRFEPQPR